MKKIKLTQDKYALVDDDDFEWLNQWKWCFDGEYVSRRKHILGSGSSGTQKTRKIYMHRLINKTPIGYETDHIDRNKLNNQRNNLRTVNHSSNRMNISLQKNNTSGYKGVSCYIDGRKKKWLASIGSERLGTYFTLIGAVVTRMLAENKYHEARG